jgi:predicted metal-binding protein
MGQKNHRVTICTSCKHTGENCRPGIELVQKLRSAMASTRDFVDDDFEISDLVSKTGCKRACTLAYQSTQDEIYIFGGVDPQSNINDLVYYAEQHSKSVIAGSLPINRQSNFELGAFLNTPAAMITLESCEMLNS